MQRNGNKPARFADRVVQGVADDGGDELVTIWIERRPGAVWAVGRAVGLEERADGAVRSDDYVFEGYEMGDALEAANQALSADVDVSREQGRPQTVDGFREQELLEPLERWFFGREPH
jgi:hypothetical protein